MADQLLDEVDADIRAERLQQLWLKYRFKLMFTVVAIIVATAGSTIWENYQQKRGGEVLLELATAQTLFEQGKFTEAAAGFETAAAHAGGDVLSMAQVWQARALVASGKKDKAIPLLQTASTRSAGLWSDLACLRLASLAMDAAKDCLADKKDSPLANQRNEWRAANLWATGQKDEAIALLEQLQSSPDTSDATRATTAEWLATMRAEKSAE